MSQIIQERIRQRLQEQAKDSRIDCGDARRIAEELGVQYSEVGRAADDLGIRIRNCELGCFS